MIALYLLFLPPFILVDPATAADDTVEYNYYVDDQTPTVELPGKQCPFPSPRYHLYFLYYSCIRHCSCCTLIPILLHYLSLSPFIIVPYLVL